MVLPVLPGMTLLAISTAAQSIPSLLATPHTCMRLRVLPHKAGGGPFIPKTTGPHAALYSGTLHKTAGLVGKE